MPPRSAEKGLAAYRSFMAEQRARGRSQKQALRAYRGMRR